MNSFKLFRTICRSTCIFRNSYFNFMYCRLDDICKNWSGITYNRLIIIVIKNQCPFCGKSLRVVPINSEEYCPHCGCKIEQEHKKISVYRDDSIIIFAWKRVRSTLVRQGVQMGRWTITLNRPKRSVSPGGSIDVLWHIVLGYYPSRFSQIS